MNVFEIDERVITPSRGVGQVEHVDLVSGVTVRVDGETWRYDPEQLTSVTGRPYQTGDHVLADGIPGRIWYITARPGNDHGTAYVNLDAPNEHGNTTTVVILTADLTASMYQHRTLVLVRPDDSPVPNPTPSGDTTPALVQLDHDDAAARVLNAAMDWDVAMAGDGSELDNAEDALRSAVRDYRAAVAR